MSHRAASSHAFVRSWLYKMHIGMHMNRCFSQALILIHYAWDPGMCRERSTSLGQRITVLRRCSL